MSPSANHSIKHLGAYYTPETIAGVLADWVVQTGSEALLEPSIGDGALLRAVLAMAARKGFGSTGLQLRGCDLNEAAIDNVRQWLPSKHILHSGDFFSLDPLETGLVQGVISNPPFTRNHALPKDVREKLRKRFNIKGAAGLWVAFLLNALRFLGPGGRMAAVIPGAALFSSYGRDALARICRQFHYAELRQIVDMPLWSSPADERGAIFLARGFAAGSCSLPAATRWSASGNALVTRSRGGASRFRQALLGARPLGDLADLSIGAVTGSNRVFLISEAERIAAGIKAEEVTPVIGKGRHVQGLQISSADLFNLAVEGEATWLLTPPDISKVRRGVRNRLAQIPPDKRRSVVWLNKRSPWWKVDAGSTFDAIFTYMNDRGPRVVIAVDRVACTNTLHKVQFKAALKPIDRLVISLSMISSFGQLAAEQIGRTYGGGILKFELTDARQFPVLLHRGPRARSAFMKADRALRRGDLEKARLTADALILPRVLGRGWEKAAVEMMAETKRMRSARRSGEAND